MGTTTFIAHSGTEGSGWRPEPLADHLNAVAERARRLLEDSGLEEAGALLGQWHDVGKYSDEFQRYIRQSSADPDGDDAEPSAGSKRVDHSTMGAQLASGRASDVPSSRVSRLIAYCIAGHHAGLADWNDDSGSGSTLRARLVREKPEFVSAMRNAPPAVRDLALPELSAALSPKAWWKEYGSPMESEAAMAFGHGMVCRVLFSALIDADRLETERFDNPVQSRDRLGEAPPLRALVGALLRYLDSLEPKPGAERVNRIRAEVLKRCRSSAAGSPGFYSLTVPTGGGKTLSGLAFALEHGARHGMRRVIYAAPYTSIIEQNAVIIRRALESAGGSDVVLEHHSALDPVNETERSRLLSENWDAPVIVTTNVQLLESLFASNTSACRKVHNIARSVIILDEAQTLPPRLLRACLTALRCLVYDHGCSVVLCTATQPALTQRSSFPIGLRGVTEIMGNGVREAFDALKRVHIEQAGFLDDQELAGALLKERSGLCIVNTRIHAATVFELVKERDPCAVHLSASMCAAHRRQRLDEILSRLVSGAPCRVVSTQVIEAGVDVDFPVVFRAMAGLDSIAQAAGRCNREGRQEGLGRVVVFHSERSAPPSIRLAAQDAAQVLPDHADSPLSPEAIATFFDLAYGRDRHLPNSRRWDRDCVMSCFRVSRPHAALEADFRRAAESFRMIDDWQVPIIVPYETTGEMLVDRVERAVAAHDRRELRNLQRLTVNTSPQTRAAMLEGGAARLIADAFCVLVNGKAYDEAKGLRTDVVALPADSLMP